MHKKVLALVAIAALVLSSCGGPSGPKVSEEEATMAFGISAGAFMFGAMEAAFGTGEGVSMSEDQSSFTFEDYDVSELASGMGTTYTNVSGSAKANLNGSVDMEFTLVGGPVQTLKMNMDDAALQSQAENGQVSFDLEANGHKMTITGDPEDMDFGF